MRITRVPARRFDLQVKAEILCERYAKEFRKRKPDIFVRLARPSTRFSTGTTYHGTPRIHITAAQSDIDFIATVVHELAHAKAGAGQYHNRVWARAVFEIADRLGLDTDEIIEVELSAQATGHNQLKKEHDERISRRQV